MENTTLSFETISRRSQDFYRQIYVVQTLTKQELIDLNEFGHDRQIVVVDSCGWYYHEMFPNHKIHCVEGITTCKNMNIGRDRVDRLFDDRNPEPRFPEMNFLESVLIVDHSLLLKYQTPQQIFKILNLLASATNCKDMCVRIALLYSNDNRFQNRLSQWTIIVPTGYSVVKFDMNLNAKYQPLIAHFKKNVVNE